jgi:uncharacterized protein YceK
MRPLPLLIGSAFAALVGLAGCGTVHNLNDPMVPTDPQNELAFLTACSPFGGVTRSGTLALFGEPVGISQLLNGELAEGGKFFTFGVLAWADIPLSLAGDVVTFPVAYARSKGEPWASWWNKGESTGERMTCPFAKASPPSVPTPVPDPTSEGR